MECGRAAYHTGLLCQIQPFGRRSVSEVASAGGFVKEYQVELNPDAMRAFNVSVMDIMGAIKKSNLDIGAETMEINKVEYLIRGLGYIKDVSDLEKAVVTVHDGVPVRISDVAFVNIGPGTRAAGWIKKVSKQSAVS